MVLQHYNIYIMNKLINKYFGCPDKIQEVVNVASKTDPFVVSSRAATEFADQINPVIETGMRRNDVDVAMSCKDPTLQNTLLKGLSKDVNPYQSDNEGISDDEIASQAVPRNMHISDIVDTSSDLQETILASHTQTETDPSPVDPETDPVPNPSE